MAVTKRNQGNNNTRNAAPAQGQSWEKAAAFINIGLPTRGGGDPVRLDSIKLKVSNVVHKQIIDLLEGAEPADRAALLEQIKSRLVLDFQLIRADEDKELDLGLEPAA